MSKWKKLEEHDGLFVTNTLENQLSPTYLLLSMGIWGKSVSWKGAVFP